MQNSIEQPKEMDNKIKKFKNKNTVCDEDLLEIFGKKQKNRKNSIQNKNIKDETNIRTVVRYFDKK
jgi:alpha-galactosidase